MRAHASFSASALAAGTLVALALVQGALGHPFFSRHPHPHHQHHHRSRLLPRPAVFAPQPAPPPPFVHNSVIYRLHPDAMDADDALDVSQFHSQDSAGRVLFGFNTPDQSRIEARSLDGSVHGSYSYQDPTGKLVQVHYWDDGDGFHVSGNNLPQAAGHHQYYQPQSQAQLMPAYTPEVEEARRQHFRLFQQALLQAQAQAIVPQTPTGTNYEEESGKPEDETHADDRDSVAVENNEQKGEKEVNKGEGVEGEVVGVEEKPLSDYEDSDDSVAVESAASASSATATAQVYPGIRAAPSPSRYEPEANRKQVAQPTHLTLDRGSGGVVVLARTGPDGRQYLVPVAEFIGGGGVGLSESRHAAMYGAIPIGAVHDAQVSPSQRMGVDGHQLKPLLLRTG